MMEGAAAREGKTLRRYQLDELAFVLLQREFRCWIDRWAPSQGGCRAGAISPCLLLDSASLFTLVPTYPRRPLHMKKRFTAAGDGVPRNRLS